MAVGRVLAAAALVVVMLGGGGYVSDLMRSPAAPKILLLPLPRPVAPFIQFASEAMQSEAGITVAAGLSLSEQILQRAPLSSAPFEMLSDIMLKAGDADRAREFALIALDRDPRNVRLHLQLANDAAQRGDLPETVKRLALLLRIDRDQRKTYLAAMLRIAGTHVGQGLVERELRSQPSWGPAMVDLLTPSHPDLAFVGRLARAFPNGQDGYISRMVRERGATVAYAEWIELLPPSLRAHAGETPFNPGFATGLAASPPFSWRVRSTAAEINIEGGLYANYDGRDRPTLVEQLLVLSPGPYRIEISAVSATRPKGGVLAWSITCRDANNSLLKLTLPDSDYQTKAVLGDFVVPTGNCDGQYLRLTGLPSEFVTGATAEIAAVRIIKSPSTQ